MLHLIVGSTVVERVTCVATFSVYLGSSELIGLISARPLSNRSAMQRLHTGVAFSFCVEAAPRVFVD